MDDLIPEAELPQGFEYPAQLLEILHSGRSDFGPWQLLVGKWLGVRYAGLKQRYPQRQLIPFARRVDCDDVACFETTEGVRPLVQVIHDFAAPGWEQRRVFDSFDAWLASAEAEEE